MMTNPIGKGTKNLSVNMPLKMRAALSDSAAKNGMTQSEYVRSILREAVRTKPEFQTVTTVKYHGS